ncbi:hypothetical protein F5J12DRAFT_774292 [Pisolithus orientalis]|uniref:uncharacterized protein n=1 Tax=Pisolithus orientalis TaxID=936130 RepID=UPI002223F959|nr:uncharacterized protein F5J12DRAFT_774292 [Pisolithus orientalis]KAI5990336.1 hypothetical protein F5J12DRAFT_774292 [Pisolithus orientalis]
MRTLLRIPSLPLPPRQDTIHVDYMLSTHIIPAVLPRLVPDIPIPKVPTYINLIPASERWKQATTVIRELIERQMCFAQGKLTGDCSQKPLWNCVNRYVRVHRCDALGTGLTLFLVPATGFPKEVSITSHFPCMLVTGILDMGAYEAVNHGDSALVNAGSLSGIFDWHDGARDIANFLLNYLPEESTPVPLPTCLARVPEATSNTRKELGYHCRRLVVAGHSFGGTSLTLAALNFPKLFSSHPWQQFLGLPTVFRYIYCVRNNVPNRCHHQGEVPANSSNGREAPSLPLMAKINVVGKVS